MDRNVTTYVTNFTHGKTLVFNTDLQEKDQPTIASIYVMNLHKTYNYGHERT